LATDHSTAHLLLCTNLGYINSIIIIIIIIIKYNAKYELNMMIVDDKFTIFLDITGTPV